MAGTGQTAVIAAFIAAFLAGAVALRPAAAQGVPLPPPAPLPKTGVAPAPPSVPSAKPAPAPPAATGGPSWLPSIFGGQQAAKPGASTTFEPRQQALVDKVSAYLSNVHVMSGNF